MVRFANFEQCKFDCIIDPQDGHFDCKAPTVLQELSAQLFKLTKEKKESIVNELNEIRTKWVIGHPKGFPQASNMNQLYWRRDLEWISRKTLETGWEDIGHKTNCYNLLQISLESEREAGNGDNDASGQSVTKWNQQILEVFTTSNFTAYSQLPERHKGNAIYMLSASARFVGCASSHFTKDGKPFEKFICTFFPVKEVGQLQIYKYGKPCECEPPSFCGKDHKYPKLCAVDSSDILDLAYEEESSAMEKGWEFNVTNDFCKQTATSERGWRIVSISFPILHGVFLCRYFY